MVTFLKGGDPIYEGQDNFHQIGYNGGMIVYKITNLVNGKFYIGITTKSLKKRFDGHKRKARARGKTYLYTAMRSYGEELFTISKLKECGSVQEMKEEEIRLISILAPQYNLTKGGDGVTGYVFAPEVVKRIADKKRGKSTALKGRKRSPEVCAKLSEAFKGRIPWNKGKILGEDFRKMRSEYMKKNPLPRPSDESIMKMVEGGKATRFTQKKKILCTTDGLEFNHINDVVNYYGFKKSSIYMSTRTGWKLYGKNFEAVDL